MVPTVELLRPATLAYLDPNAFRPSPGPVLELDAHNLHTFGTADPEATDESGIDAVTPSAFTVVAEASVIAATGHRIGPTNVATYQFRSPRTIVAAALDASWHPLPQCVH